MEDRNHKSPGSEDIWKELELKLMEAGGVDRLWSWRNRKEASWLPSSNHLWVSFSVSLLRKLSFFSEHYAPDHECIITTIYKAKESREAQGDERQKTPRWLRVLLGMWFCWVFPFTHEGQKALATLACMALCGWSPLGLTCLLSHNQDKGEKKGTEPI